MKYPKITAALDDVVAKFVREHTEDAVVAFLAFVSKPPEPFEEKLPPIPVTKEEVLDGD